MDLNPERKRSWVESANDPATDFPLENLPFGRFERDGRPIPCLAIGDLVLDLEACGLPGSLAARARAAERLSDPEKRAGIEPHLVPQKNLRMLPPFDIGDYTDFYASIHHATNVGRLFRPDNPLLPNYKYVPIGYHGRASSIVVSGTEIRRPWGQTKAPDAPAPAFTPTRMLDYELEVGFFVGAGNPLGEPVPMDRAEEHILGFCLLNDWSARDIQSWEYQPLGPFLGKSFATTISPWVVPLAALEPFRVPAAPRPGGDPGPLPYLTDERDQRRGAFDLHLEVCFATAKMRAAGQTPVRISLGNLRDLYWTPAQMLAHHTSNGCNLRPGDLLATGTVSGSTPESVGSLLERTRRGAEPFHLPNGEQRSFLEDGDEVVMRGWCECDGYPRIGFGECRGTIAAAHG